MMEFFSRISRDFGREKRLKMKTPVRIYVLWHPSFRQGKTLARRIYHWFRLPSAEGIPVYFRSVNDPFSRKDWEDYELSCQHDILLPLVDPYMVASLPWRRYLEGLAGDALQEERGERSKLHLRPIAMHTTAYQLPSSLRSLNFIRATESSSDNEQEILMTLSLIHI